MKKQYWVDLLVICFSLLFVSCASLRQNSDIVVDTALNLANKQIELNLYEDAINTYNRALNEGNDYRLLYNKSILLAKMGSFDEAIITAKVGYNLYPTRYEFLKILAHFYFNNNMIEDFESSYEQYISKNDSDIDSKIEYARMCSQTTLQDKAYDLALNMWESGIDKKEVVEILYSINPDEWEVLNRVLH